MKQFITLLALFLIKPGFAQTGEPGFRKELQQQIRGGNYINAIAMLEPKLADISNDTTGLFDALVNLYFYEKNWSGIIHAFAMHTVMPGEDTTTLSIARFCSQQPPEEIVLQEKVTLPFKAASGGTPIIEVKVNGRSYHFWLDTGAGMTVLSSSTARDCGIRQAINTEAVAVAATGKVLSLDPGLIDSLEIQSLKAYHHPCIILDKKDLEFRILGIRILKIDGIIGWNLLQELDIVIDHKTDSLRVDLPQKYQSSHHNFFWMGQPLIACTETNGDSCFFFLDTGAAGSGIYTSFLTHEDTIHTKKKNMLMGSAGGVIKSKAYMLPEVQLSVAGKPIKMNNVFVFPSDADQLLPADGVLGITEFRNNNIHFNMKNGFFEIND